MFKGLLILAMFSSVQAQANSGENTLSVSQTAVQGSTLKIKDVIKNKKFEDDKEITDSRLKADSGSLSRYSLKFSLSYFGPPIGDLSNENQPNPDGSIGKKETAIGGSISGRYRLDSKSAIGVGTGISFLTPMHGVKRTDVRNPYVTYDRNGRLGEVQMRNSYGASVTTVPDFRDVGQYGSLSYDNSLVYNLGPSGFALGLDSSLSAFLYERGYEARDRKASRYFLGIFPQVKYNVTDKLNVYSSVAMTYLNPRSVSSESILLNQTLSGRVGMGWAYSRDIYIAPYLNFYPGDLRTESTTFSASMIFSVL